LLVERFRAELARGGALPCGGRVVVALSGGLDSVVLLHLLRFGAPLAGVDVVAAHFDHAMRPSSASDALWVAGLCRAWEVPLAAERAAAAPSSEEEAREARYAFLERVRRASGSLLVLTAHHADDQAETVLFRLLRGTGQAGLAGIAPRREPSLYRPLLEFWRNELQAYAIAHRLAWREDPTNRDLLHARNALRTRVLPEIERLVAPGARKALVRLAERAREEEAAWNSMIPGLLATLDVRRQAGGTSLARSALLRLPPAARARVLRHLAATVGVRLDEHATRRALEFALSGASGRRVDLGGGWTLLREFERLVFSAQAGSARGSDRPLLIPDPVPGGGEALLGGRPVPVRWGRGAERLRLVESFEADRLRFPLVVRAREPGDRIRLSSGTKKVKELLRERRIAYTLRGTLPVLADAEGAVLWIPGVARARNVAESSGSALVGAREQWWIGVG
jgi:tRNA(Ile)-lysidine synthase